MFLKISKRLRQRKRFYFPPPVRYHRGALMACELFIPWKTHAATVARAQEARSTMTDIALAVLVLSDASLALFVDVEEQTATVDAMLECII